MAARGAALAVWMVALLFGAPAPVVARYLLRHDALPMFLGIKTYGGGLFERLEPEAFAAALGGFALLLVVEAGCAVLLWDGARKGGLLVLALLPVEAVFWIGFALPIPPLLAVIRLFLLYRAWSLLA